MMNTKGLELKLSDALQREDVLKQQLAESQREFRAADATIENMQMQVEKLAAENAGLKAREVTLPDERFRYGESDYDDGYVNGWNAHGIETKSAIRAAGIRINGEG